MSFERVKTVTAPSSLPLLISDVKDYLRIEGNIDDQVVLRCIRAAADWIGTSDGCGYALMKQRWAYHPPQFNRLEHQDWRYCDAPVHIRIPGWPLADTEGTIKYTAKDDAAETSETITLSDPHQAGFIYALRPSTGWPSGLEPYTPVAIEYEVGHADRADIPHDMQMAIRLLAVRFYEMRGTGEMDPGIERIISKYRRWA